jgi:hypothetical protein
VSLARSEERRSADEARWGRCPVCGEVLAHDGEEDLTFCPEEEDRHPDLPSRLAVQAMPASDAVQRFLVGATSVDGRSSSIEVLLGLGAGARAPGDLELPEVAARLARALLAAGARRGTYAFPAEQLDNDALSRTLSQISVAGIAAFAATSPQ